MIDSLSYYWNRITQHLGNWWNYFLEHLVRFIFLSLIMSGLCFGFSKLPINNIYNEHGVLTEQHILILNITLTNWSIFFGIIATILAAIWGIYQYDKNRNLKQQHNASKIAERFARNNLLYKCEIVNTVIKSTPLYEYINKYKEYDTFKDFTIAELRYVYDNDKIPTLYSELRDSIDFDSIYYSILDNRISNKPFEIKKYNTKAARKLFILDNEGLPFHFLALVDDVLNDLEYVCMDISSQAAGDKYIYLSLHQSFLRTIKTLSIDICIRNCNKYSDKFYTNIIYVYNNWTKLYKLNLKKEQKRHDKANKLLNPKIKTV